jgi:MFS family permease
MSSQLEVATPEFISVVAGAVIVMLGFGLIVPVMPLFAKRFPGIGDLQVAYIVIGFAAMRLAGNVFVGRALTRLGERNTTVVGAIIVGVSSLACAGAQGYVWLLIARVVGGIGSAFYFGGLLSFMLARVKPEQRGRASSLFQGAVNAGILVGPALGGLLAGTVGIEAPFVAYGIMCLLGAAWSSQTMRTPVDEHPLAASRAGGMTVLRELLRDRAYVISLATGFVGFAVMFGAIQILMPTLWTQTLGLSTDTVGIPYTVSTGASLLVVLHAGSVVDRRGRRGPLVVASIVLAAGVALLAGADTVWLVLASMVVVGVATGYTRPATTAILGDVAGDVQRPAAVGGFRVAQDLGGLLGPAIAGVMSHFFGLRSAFVAMAVLAAIVAAFASTIRETAPHLVGGPEPEEPAVPPVIEPAG